MDCKRSTCGQHGTTRRFFPLSSGRKEIGSINRHRIWMDDRLWKSRRKSNKAGRFDGCQFQRSSDL